jgi:predicted RNA-binding protein YlxR (DUF448 family)
VGCGAKANPEALARLVAAGGRVVPAGGPRSGRSAWLHRDLACLARAVRRRAFGRALRREGLAVDEGELGRWLTAVVGKD